jgi:hypothetical protein
MVLGFVEAINLVYLGIVGLVYEDYATSKQLPN